MNYKIIIRIVIVLEQAPIYDENLANIDPASPGKMMIMIILGRNYIYIFIGEWLRRHRRPPFPDWHCSRSFDLLVIGSLGYCFLSICS